MTNQPEEVNSMQEMMEELEKSMRPIHRGDIVKGTVISVSDEEVLVNIGYMADGIIAREELTGDLSVNPQELLKAGEEIDVYILQVNDGEGNVALSKRRADAVKTWGELEEAFQKGTALQVKISELVKGGAVAYIKGVRAFIPASHLAYSYVKDLAEFAGRELEVKVIEFDAEKQRVVLSRKEIEKLEVEAKKEAFWSSLEKGQRRNGVVVRLAKFGAFVDLGGVDGLIHLSDLAWERVTDPAKVVSVGDQVEVYVLDFDQDKGRISLSLKEVRPNPWNDISAKYKKDDVVEGKIVRITDFGAFMELEPGVDGLVHVSQIAHERVTKPAAILNIGDKVKVKILDIDENKKRISLSIKEALEKEVVEEGNEDFSQYTIQEDKVTLGDVFQDKLKNFQLDK